MLGKIRIENSGDTKFLPGSLVDVLDFEDENERLTSLDKQPAEGKQIILGITKAALATSSFLSAASFQETTKVLTDAAIHGRIDPLIGLKENVILGKLIPAGTGMKRYRSTRLSTDAHLRKNDIVSDEIEEVSEDVIEQTETEMQFTEEFANSGVEE
jgi:DNA-directed RNA polymerase subunit beta'